MTTARIASAFVASRAGNIAIIFALASLPLMAFVGAAIDYGLATRLQVKLQSATDATALGLCQTPQTYTSVQLNTQANVVLPGYMGSGSTLTIDPLVITSNPRKITLNTHINSITFFPAFTHVASPVVSASSQCATPLPKTFEIALVLDNTGSMSASSGSQSKLQAAQTAASNFVDYVKGNSAFASNSRISVVPFAAAVAVDPTASAKASWVDSDGLSAYHWSNIDKVSASGASFKSRLDIFASLQKVYSGWGWAGCFEAPPYPQNVRDGAPSSGGTQSDWNSLYVPLFAPDEPGPGSTGAVCWNASGGTNCYNSSNISFNSYINDGDSSGSCSTSGSVTAVESQACKYKHPQGAQPTSSGGVGLPNGPNFQCVSKPLQRLTTDANALKLLISSMTAAGSTNIHEGLMWGWRTLSPISVFADGAAYSATATNKVIVLMTDGANSWADNPYNNYNQTLYFSLGFLQNTSAADPDPTPRLPAGYQSPQAIATSAQQRNALDQLTSEACTNAKAAGISIYTVGFSVASDPIDNQGIQLLKNCASSARQAFIANDSSGLITAFNQIAASIGSLRISK